MKSKRWRITLLVMAAVTALGSCELLYAPFNQMTIGDTSYPLSSVYVYEHTDLPGALTLLIMSTGLSVTGSQGETISGKGDYLALTLTNATGTLEKGTYTFAAATPPAIAPLLSFAVVGYDADLNEEDEGYFVGGGTIVVRTLIGGGYSIEILLEGGTADELNSSDPPEQWVWPTSTQITGRFRGDVSQTFRGSFFVR